MKVVQFQPERRGVLSFLLPRMFVPLPNHEKLTEEDNPLNPRTPWEEYTSKTND